MVLETFHLSPLPFTRESPIVYQELFLRSLCFHTMEEISHRYSQRLVCIWTS